MNEGDSATLTGLEAAGHDTQPPSRYNEASLVAKLEELQDASEETWEDVKDGFESAVKSVEGAYEAIKSKFAA